MPVKCIMTRPELSLGNRKCMSQKNICILLATFSNLIRKISVFLTTFSNLIS
uniref:Uncharacterized protein n=1 Tax=Arundo donax TaxID=35708 RepID=A0A0A9H8H5_ARUDO